MDKNITPAVKEDPGYPYTVFDKLDENQILAEIQGRVTTQWVYEVNGEKGLAKKGVDQCMLELCKAGWFFKDLEVKCVTDPGDEEFRLFTARVQGFRYTKEGAQVDMGINIGSKRQNIYIKFKNGGRKLDDFWYEKGCAKALRNAKARFIPVEI